MPPISRGPRSASSVGRRPKNLHRNSVDSIIFISTYQHQNSILPSHYLTAQLSSIPFAIFGHYNRLLMQYSRQYRQKVILYAQHCPEQPYIIQQPQPETKVTRKIIKKPEESSLTYHPRIIKSHRFSANLHEQFQLTEHERELASLYKRIKNCKSLSQRKKDHNDPIIYPSYFIRQEKRSKDARIDGYFKQIVSKKPKKHKKVAQNSQVETHTFTHKDSLLAKQKLLQSEMVLPNISKYVGFEESGQASVVGNLPACRVSEILRYLQEKQIFKMQDLMILKARMGHYYGQYMNEAIWSEVMLRLGFNKSYR